MRECCEAMQRAGSRRLSINLVIITEEILHDRYIFFVRVNEGRRDNWKETDLLTKGVATPLVKVCSEVSATS